MQHQLCCWPPAVGVLTSCHITTGTNVEFYISGSRRSLGVRGGPRAVLDPEGALAPSQVPRLLPTDAQLPPLGSGTAALSGETLPRSYGEFWHDLYKLTQGERQTESDFFLRGLL